VLGPAFKALDAVNKGVYYLIGVGLMVITVVVFWQVMVRFVLTAAGINISAPWTEEVARYVLIWCIFLGAGVGCRKAQLIALEFVVRALPSVVGQAARYLAMAVCLGFFLLMIQVGWQFVDIIGRSETSPVLQISKAWVYWAMPVGAGLMVINTIALALEAITTKRDIRLIGGLASTE
jgi:TRAP-type C4-dicarboxylate transport system permease small subunit